MHGMYMGRTVLKGRTGVLPKCYFTREAHYSIQILRDLLGLDTIFVSTLPDGGMDTKDLARKLYENKNFPALVVATNGTIFKGAIDNIDSIQNTLKGYTSYLHLDAALFGGYLPHTNHADEVMHGTNKNPTLKRYDSIAVSCHKFFGFPSPAGLYLTSNNLFNEFNALYSKVHNPEYIGHVPGTITCSRDGVKPAEFYYFSTPQAMAKQSEDAALILKNTDYLLTEMQSHFPSMLPIRASGLSNTIYFKKPPEWIVKKYSLATMSFENDGKIGDYAHIVVMPHAGQDVIANFLADLRFRGAQTT